MTERSGNIEAHRITKPIQLLAAWLLGLILIDTAFLTAAATITQPAWASGLLIIAAISNVPIFLISLFMLQTKFRPEMQEDVFYSQYLEQKTKSVSSAPSVLVRSQTTQDNAQQYSVARTVIARTQRDLLRLREDVQKLKGESGGAVTAGLEEVSESISEAQGRLTTGEDRLDWARFNINLNDTLPRYSEIRAALKKAGIPVDRIFGSTNDPPVERPTRFQLSIGSGPNKSHIRALLEILLPYGLELVEYDDNPYYARKVYIGSYAHEGGTEGVMADRELLEFVSRPDVGTDEILERLTVDADL